LRFGLNSSAAVAMHHSPVGGRERAHARSTGVALPSRVTIPPFVIAEPHTGSRYGKTVNAERVRGFTS
jgi:hypothetical protein